MAANQFPTGTARELVAQARASKRAPVGRIPDRRAGRTPQLRPGMLCVATSAITGCTGSGTAYTLGHGTVKPLDISPSRVTSDAGYADMDVLNSVDSAIATGKLCQLLWIDGYWFVVVVNCGGG